MCTPILRAVSRQLIPWCRAFSLTSSPVSGCLAHYLWRSDFSWWLFFREEEPTGLMHCSCRVISRDRKSSSWPWRRSVDCVEHVCRGDEQLGTLRMAKNAARPDIFASRHGVLDSDHAECLSSPPETSTRSPPLSPCLKGRNRCTRGVHTNSRSCRGFRTKRSCIFWTYGILLVQRVQCQALCATTQRRS